MSIASEITRISTNVADAYAAADAKGATMPVSQNSDNLATTIASIPQEGGGAVIDSLTITPTTSAQTITAPTGLDGYNPISVSAVTSSIDANIVAGNIKKDVSILGVTGSYEGVTPSGTLSITQNGTYDVTNYASADVNVSATIEGIYRTYRVINGYLYSAIDSEFRPFPAEMENLTSYKLYEAYYQTPATVLGSNVNMSSIKRLSGKGCCERMFNSCNGTGTFTVNLSNLTTIDGTDACSNMFSSSTITAIDLSNLTTVSGSNGCNSIFNGCTNLASISLPKLKTVSGTSAFSGAFQNDTALTSITFPVLSTITGRSAFSTAFAGCTNLTSISFPALTSSSFGTATNAFSNMISGVSDCTIHFPSNLDPESGSTVISKLTGYPNFGGTNTVLSFDLPATE